MPSGGRETAEDPPPLEDIGSEPSEALEDLEGEEEEGGDGEATTAGSCRDDVGVGL